MFSLTVAAGPEQSLKHESRVWFGGDWYCRRTPGHVVLIGTCVAGIAASRVADRVTTEFQRGKAGQVPQLLGGKLIDRDSEANVFPARFFGSHSGQVCRTSASVITAAIISGRRIEMIETSDDMHVFLKVLKWLHRAFR